MNGKVVQVPQTTKNSEQKINDLFQQINSYKTFIKKAKPSVDSGSIQNSKSGFAQKASSKTRKDNPNFSIDNTSSLAAKKSSENFKKYLSGHGNANSGYNSFK